MERAFAGAGIVLDILQRAKSGVFVTDSDKKLSNAIGTYGQALWITRFHPEVLDHEQMRHMLINISVFEQEWPKAAVEIGKEVGWPDDSESLPRIGDGPVGLQPF